MKKLIYTLFVVFLFTGCNSGKEKLSGRVVFPDGEPLTVGMIYFTNDHFTARAQLRSDGSYDVGSLAEKDGLPAGTYKVHISGAIEVNSDGSEIPLVAREFAADTTTPLTITVPGERVYNIEVERPKSKQKP